MAITTTAKGTTAVFDNGDGTDFVTLASVAIANGASVVVLIGYSLADGAIVTSVTWNGQALAQDASKGNGFNCEVEVWSLHGVTGATGDVGVQFDAPIVSHGIVVAAREVTGLAATPLDKTHTGSGLGTSPSSGATATTAQADEILIGAIGASLAGLDVGGTWDNSFTDGQSINDGAEQALNEGYRIVSATGAYTGSKTLATSGQWAAAIVTYKAAAGTAWTLTPSDTTTSNDATAKADTHPVSDTTTPTDDASKAVGKSASDTTTSTDAKALAPRSVQADATTSTDAQTLSSGGKIMDSTVSTDDMGFSNTSLDTGETLDVNVTEQLVDDFTGRVLTVPQGVYRRHQRYQGNCGAPYFAFQTDWAAETGQGFAPGVGPAWLQVGIVVALREMPVQLLSQSEPHYLFSYSEPGVRGPLIEVGVTPSGALCAWTADRGFMVSPPGLIRDDNVPHLILFEINDAGGGAVRRSLALDGAVVFADQNSGANPSFALQAHGGTTMRAMLFNGVAGATRCHCSISQAYVYCNRQAVRWPIDEGTGTTLRSQLWVIYPFVVGAANPIITPGGNWVDADPPDAATKFFPPMPMSALWYDPSSLGYPLLYGTVPTSDPATCYSWGRRTDYRERVPVRPDYRPVATPGTDFEGT